MKTLEEIKEERDHEMDYSYWEEFIYRVDDPNILDMEFDEVAKRYAKEVAREALRNASESARVMAEDTVTGNGVEVASWTDCDNFKFSISKTSILNESNIPELWK